MMKTEQAISELQKFLSFKRAGEHAEDVLKKLQDAEGETKEQEKKRDKLKEENAKLAVELSKTAGAIEAAQVKATDIVSKAEAQATAAIEAAQDTIALNQSAADKKLADTNKATSDAETRRVVAEGMAKDAEAKLAEINKELEAAKARAQRMAGV